MTSPLARPLLPSRRAIALLAGGSLLALLIGALPPAPSASAGPAPGPLPDGVPSVSISAPGTVSLGASFTFTVTFDNTSATDTGYGPFIDLIFPVNGADGAAGSDTPDGIDFTGATYLGAAVTSVELTFPADGGGTGCVDHPYARDTSGAFIQVCGTTGDKLVVLLLPFGSFTPTQPAAVIDVGATLSPLADLGTPLTLRARGGFRFGNTPLDDWCCDPVILLPTSNDGTGWPSADVAPTLISISKAYIGPEDETATGPNYPRQYTITVSLAPGQTVSDLDVTDELPNNLAFLSVDSISPAGSVVQTPTVGAAANPPDNRLVVNFPSVTGSATVTFSFFVPQFDADGSPVVDPVTGDDETSDNRAGAVGDWTPLDPRDAGATDNAVAGGVCPACAILHSLNDRSIAVQKGVTIAVDTGTSGPSPGDTLEYTLQFQISDFFGFDDVVLTDVLSDGQRVDGGFTPTLAVAGNGFTLGAAAMDAANFDVVCNYSGVPGAECTADDPAANDGGTTLIFRASDELVSRGQANGFFVGGCVPPGGTGGPDPDCTTYNDGPTTGAIVFRAVIQDEFSDDFPSGDESVDQGDVLGDDVSVSGDVLETDGLAFATGSEADGSSAGVTIPRGSPDKSIYAVNGEICSTQPCEDVEVEPGDTLTFRLQYGLPTSDFEDLYLVDYLPLPVFDATEVTPPFDPTVSAAAPPAGTAKFGPADTFYNSRPPASNIAPTITTDAVGNSVQFTYGSYDDPTVPPPSTAVDILFTVTVSNEPFTDRLLLTNQLRVHEGSTNSTDVDDDAIVQFTLRQPFLAVRKGVIATDQLAGVFTPAATGPVTFTDPGTLGTRFTPPIESDGIDATPIDSDLSGVDADDLVSFAITIENQGSSRNGAFDIVVTDTLQPGFVIPAGGLNLTVTRGDGSAVTYSGADTDLFGAGIQLDDPGTGVGVCEVYAAGGGRNIVVITYDLQLDPTVEPSQVITNTAEVVNYAGEEGGPDHTGDGPNPAFQNQASTTIAGVGLAKDVTDTNQGFTSGLNVTIGEIVSYTLSVTVPEGTSTGVTLTDTLDQGLAFVALDSVISSSGDLTWTGPATADISEFPVGSVLAQDQGRRMTIDFGDMTNANIDDAVAEVITIVYRTVVINSAGNQDSPVTLLNNAAVWEWTEGTSTASAPNVTVVEPVLQVTKTPDVSSGDAGDTVTFTVVVSHAPASSSDAFEVAWSDTIPTGMTYVGGSLGWTGVGNSPDTLDASGAPTLTATWASFPLGSTSTLTFQVTLDATVSPAQVITNTAAIEWTGLPGDVTTPQTGNNALSTERTGDSANPGGSANDYLASGTADVTVFSQPTKSIAATSEAHTTTVSGIESVVIGEIVRYRLEFLLAEGTALDFQLEDLLPAGLQFLDDNTAMVALVADDAGISSSTLSGPGLNVTGDETTLASITPTFVLPDAAVSNNTTSDVDTYVSGTDVFFKLGDLTNDDRDLNQEFAVVEFNAVVLNISGNQAYNNATGATSTTNRDNSFRPRIDGVAGTASSAVRVRIAEPLIVNLAKNLVVAPSDAGDPVQYTLVFSNTSSGFRAAAAFDIRVLDTLDSNLTLTGVSVSAPGYAVVTDGSADPTVDVTIDRLNPGDSVTVTIDAVVVDDAPIGISISNTASLTYTSLPGPTGTAGNPTGSTPGAAGTPTGERTGADGSGGLNDYVDSASVGLSLSDPAISKSIAATSVASTGSGEYDLSVVDLVIGEEATFEIVVTLPEGTAVPLIVTDNLPTVPQQQGILRAISASLVSVGASLSAVPPFPAPGPFGTISDSDGDTIEDQVVFDFGDVTNTPDNVSDAGDQIVLQIVARVENVADNQSGDLLTNDVVVDAGGETAAVSADVEIVEPELTIAKLADDDTPGLGQTVTYTLTVSHLGSSTADAEDVVVSDTIPAGLTYVPGSASAPAAWTANDAGAPTLAFSGTLTQADATAVLSYQVTVDLPPSANVGDVFLNTADLTWTSVPGASDDERDGGGGVDDYSDASSESLTVTGIDLTLTKDDGGIGVVPGDTIAYSLTIENVGNAGATGVTISDVVPDYTTFSPGASSAGWSCSPDNSAGSTCTYVYGALAAGAGDTLIFAVTVDPSVPVLVTLISNEATIADDGANGIEPTPADNTDSDTTPLSAAPDLTIVKDDGLSVVAPGTQLVYTLTYDNVGDQDASGVTITDVVPDYTTFNPGASSVGWSCTPDNSGGSTCSYDIGDLVVGAGPLVIIFTVDIDTSVPGGVTQIANTAVIADDGTNGVDQNPADNTSTDVDSLVTLPNVDLDKTLIDTNQLHTSGFNAAIGEILTYRVEITVPAGGTMSGLTLTDSLDPGLALVDCVAVSGPGLTTSLPSFDAACDPPTNPSVGPLPPGDPADENQGRRIVFDLGDVSNSGAGNATLTIDYTVVALDSAGNVRGVTMANAVVLNWTGGSLAESAPAVTLVEPTLILAKSASPSTALPGTAITFTLTIDHHPSSDSPAFDLLLTDVVNSDLTYVPGSLILVSGQAPTEINDIAAPTLIVRWDTFNDTGTPTVIEFQAELGNLGAGDSTTNTAALEWSSLPGDFTAPQSAFNLLSTERFYDPGDAVNIYGVSASAGVEVPLLPATGFAPGRITPLPAEPMLPAYARLADLWLSIPSLGVRVPIVGVPAVDGRWDLTWLLTQAGYLEGTAFPTRPGNSALTAHAYLADGTRGPFAALGDLRWGEEIQVVGGDAVYVYSIREVRRVRPESLSPLRHEDYAWLTLITCEGFDEAQQAYERRVVVRAVLVEIRPR